MSAGDAATTPVERKGMFHAFICVSIVVHFTVLFIDILCVSGREKHYCNACALDITMLVSVQCAECEDVDLCVECFAQGAELYSHKKTHSYRIRVRLLLSFFFLFLTLFSRTSSTTPSSAPTGGPMKSFSS